MVFEVTIEQSSSCEPPLSSGLVVYGFPDLFIRSKAIPMTKQTNPVTATVEANTRIFRDICLSFRSVWASEFSKSSGKWLPRRNCNSWFSDPISRELSILVLENLADICNPCGFTTLHPGATLIQPFADCDA